MVRLNWGKNMSDTAARTGMTISAAMVRAGLRALRESGALASELSADHWVVRRILNAPAAPGFWGFVTRANFCLRARSAFMAAHDAAPGAGSDERNKPFLQHRRNLAV